MVCCSYAERPLFRGREGPICDWIIQGTGNPCCGRMAIVYRRGDYADLLIISSVVMGGL